MKKLWNSEIWKDKVLTGPKYGSGVSLSVGILLLVHKMFNLEIMWSYCITLIVIGVLLWILCDRKDKQLNEANDEKKHTANSQED